MRKKIILLFLCFSLHFVSFAQSNKIAKSTNKTRLLQIAENFNQRVTVEKRTALFMAKQLGWEVKGVLPNGQEYELIAVREGRPIYYITDNVDAAATTSTTALYSGPFNVTGNSISPALGGYARLGEWDGGAVRLTHQEFDGVGGTITQIDGATSLSNHATHVAGTMVANGTNASARGMAFNADLSAHDFFNDESEMAIASSNEMLVSNHSYGTVTGWANGSWSGNSGMHWWGNPSISATEDYRFGFYDGQARDWDLITNAAPYYLPVKSAGNDRNDSHSGTHYVFSGGSWISSTDARDDDGGSTGYDCVSTSGNAKNILTVGAVNAIPSGYSAPSDVVMSSFSGWGPTDDGRIKPDIVGNGVGLFSSYAGSDTNYGNSSGTSMSAPNVSGSLILLQEHYENLYGAGNFMLSSTLKGLVLHTANEAGSADGPDYKHGWGLLDTEAAAQAITDAHSGTGPSFIQENTLNDSDTYTLNITSNGQPLRVTICWNDPAGTPVSASLDPTDLMLVNDLDARITHGATTHSPYILDPSSPANAATTGDNFRDNVEQIYISATTNGDTYTLTINHKGSLSGGSQVYSLIISGASDVSLPPNDLATLSLVAPTNGREFTSSALSGTESITMKIKNVGGNDVSGFSLNYRINGGSTITENYVGTLNSGIEEDYTFATTADLSSVGTYSIEAWVDLPADIMNTNDQVTTNIKHLANTAITLPFTEDFESLTNQTHTTDQFGLEGLDRADFEADNNGNSRIRTELEATFTDIAYSGSNALSLDVSSTGIQTTNVVDFTFNLSNYTSSANLVFDVQCMQHGDEANPEDRIFIRGSDTDTWIEVYDWQSNSSNGVYTLFTEIDISANLAANSQSPSSSFQIRLQQRDNFNITSLTGLDGVSFDDIRIYEANPQVSFVVPTNSQDEDNTNASLVCQDYRDYTVEMSISQAPTGDALITPSLAGTAMQGIDYEITPSTITFANASSSNQSFSLRVFDDAEVESDEDIIITYAISGSTDAVAGSSNQTHTFTIINDDNNPGMAGVTDLFIEDWSAGDFTTNNWTTTEITTGQDLEISGSTNKYVDFDYSPQYASGYSGIYLTSPVIDGTGISSIKLDYEITIADDASEVGDAYIDVEYKRTSDASWTIIESYQNDDTGGSNLYDEVDKVLSLADGQNFQVRFHYSGTDNYTLFGIDLDNIRVHGTGASTAIANTTTSEAEYLGPNQTINFYTSSGEIMATIENLSTHDYGCTTVEIDRTGTGGTTFFNTATTAQVTDKTFKVTPTNNNASGSYHIKLYYTESEITGWETATGNDKSNLNLLKSPDAIADGTTTDAVYGTSPSLGSLGSHYYIEAEFSTGFSGFGGAISGTGGPLYDSSLPITLLSFQGERQDRENVLLTWTTIAEINNVGFEIEMSNNAQDFEKIGFVDGAGNSTETLNYQFTFGNTKSAYYRLKQIDLDGSFTYSNPVFVSASEEESLVRIYPNPLSQNKKLNIETDLREFSIIVSDTKGLRLFEAKGSKEALEDTLNQSFKNFAEGVYILQIISTQNKQVLRLVKR